MPGARLNPPLKIFLSYSHHDEELCSRFLVHLSQLKREGLIESWQDRLITAGTEWAGAIDDHVNSANVIILLVTPDFLASDYCNDVEMNRAVERSRNGEARLVSVILKPCDWKTSRFAPFQVLPKDGKPVVDWKTRDHGFDDAVKRLRQLVIELCSPASGSAQVMRVAVRRHPWRWATALVVTIILLGSSLLWSSSRGYLRQGAAFLNVGRYADAQAPLQQARKLNPFSAVADCGLLAVQLDSMRSDRVRFEQGLADAQRQYPRCAYLKVLAGDEKYSLGNRDGALAEYQDAVKREPNLAEAYFDMGRILDLEGQPDSALGHYEKAVQISPSTAQYTNNLADLYFRRAKYDDAIATYGRIARYPLAALEAAKIYRLQNKLSDAQGREEDAVRWLKDTDVQHAEAQTAWAFDVSPVQQIRLGPVEEKVCYAGLELAVTVVLQDGNQSALAAISSALNQCSSRQQELKDILRWELRRLGNEVPTLTARSEQICALLNFSCQ